jgi:hypothetical protein
MSYCVSSNRASDDFVLTPPHPPTLSLFRVIVTHVGRCPVSTIASSVERRSGTGVQPVTTGLPKGVRLAARVSGPGIAERRMGGARSDDAHADRYDPSLPWPAACKRARAHALPTPLPVSWQWLAFGAHVLCFSCVQAGRVLA